MTVHRLLPTAKLPDWVFAVARDGYLTSKELRDIYGVSKSLFQRWVVEGLFPKPDKSDKGFADTYCNPAHRWQVRTVIKFAKEHHGN